MRILVCFTYLDPLVGLQKGEGQQKSTMVFRWAKVRPYVVYGLTLPRTDSIWMNIVLGAALIADPAPFLPILAWPPQPSLMMAMSTAGG